MPLHASNVASTAFLEAARLQQQKRGIWEGRVILVFIITFT